jgi:hypothetical protein
MKLATRGLTKAAAAAGISAMLALTGCGSDDSDGGGNADGGESSSSGAGGSGSDSLPDDAVEALRGAESLHATGKMQWLLNPVDAEVRMDREGNCVGSVADPERGSYEVIIQGDDVWVKPDARYWESEFLYDAEMIAEIEGLYLHETRDEALSATLEICDPDTFVDMTKSFVEINYEITEGEATEHEGVPVRPFDTAGGDISMLVAAEGEPYPVYLKDPEYVDVDLTFSDFGEPVQVEAPPADSVITRDELVSLKVELS